MVSNDFSDLKEREKVFNENANVPTYELRLLNALH